MSKEYELAFRMNAELDAKFSRVFTSASSKIGHLEEKLNELEKESKGVEKVGGKLSGTFQNIGKQALTAAGAIAKITAGGILAGGAAIGGAGALIYNFTASTAEGMAQLKASTGATSVQMEELRKISKALYKDGMGEDFGDLTQSLATVSQVTKLQGDALKQTTQYAIAYRDVFGEDITESIKASDTMMKNFGISSADAFNLLSQGAQNGLNKSNELLDSANEYAPHFASLGFSANEMFDTFSAGLEGGAFNLDKVGDAVKEFNIKSKDMSKTSVSAYEAIGLNAEKMSRIFAEGGPTAQVAFKQVVKAISSIKDPVKRNAIGVGLFGTMFEDLEDDVVKAMGEARNQFDMTNKTMEQVLDDKYDTPKRGWQRIGRTIQTDLLLPIGEKLLPYMDKFSDKTQEFANKYGPQIATSVTKAIDKVNEYINKHYINNPDFQKLETIDSKVQFIFEDIEKSFTAWWAKSGEKGFKDFTLKIVNTIADSFEANADVIGSALWSMLNQVDEAMYDLAANSKWGWLLKYNPGYQAGKAMRKDTVEERSTPYEFQNQLSTTPFGGVGFSSGKTPFPSITGYADGDIVNHPTLGVYGEAGTEAFIPINNKPRSRALWAETGQRMGLLGGGDTFHYSPNIILPPGSDRSMVDQAVQAGHTDFSRQMSSWKAQQRRVSFGGI